MLTAKKLKETEDRSKKKKTEKGGRNIVRAYVMRS
jgi:hypothetical protein